MSSLIRERYFAAAPDSELGDKLYARFDSSQRDVTNRAARWNAAFLHYYGDETEAGRTWGMTRRGDKGELAAIRINRARRNSKARQALITSGRVVWRPRASTSDVEAEMATLIAKTWLDHDYQVAGVDELWKHWVEYSEVFGDAYAFTEFDWTRGSPMQTPQGIMRDGDVRTSILPPWLVTSDNAVATANDSNWQFVVTPRAKVDLAMLYTRIQRGESFEEGENAERLIYDARSNVFQPLTDRYGEDHSDTADVLNFVHKPTLAMPLGLFVRMLGPDCILEKRPLIGEHGDYDFNGPHPVLRLSADEMAGTPYAWAPFFNVLANQELLDGIDTVAATIVTGYGNPIYAIPHGAGEKPEKLGVGNRIWRMGSSDKKPELVERPEISESLLKFREELSQDMVQDFAINDSALGKLPDSERNAQAEALAASMAVQQVAPQAIAARRALMQLEELRLKTLRKNIRGERLLKAVGESRRHLLESTKFFTARQIEPLESVELEEGNPMEDTPQGRQYLLEFYGEKNLIKSQEDIDSVIATGRLDAVVDPVRDENMLIEAENEMIQRGEAPMVFPTQNDVLHYRKHACPTYSIAALRNPALLKAQAQHADAHYQQRYGIPPMADPMFRARHEFLMGLSPQDVPAAPMPPGGPQIGAPGAPPPQPGAPAGGPPPPHGPKEAPPSPSQVQPAAVPGAKMVNEPKNPLTKQAFQPNVPPVGGPPQ